MGKGKKKDKEKAEKKEKGLKKKCCEKYLKKGEHKRCKRCPCFDMSLEKRKTRWNELGISAEINT